jgi:DNA polymerase
MSAEEWSAQPFVPKTRNLTVLARAAAGCKGCPLFADATQAVFGKGPKRPGLVLVGEQPGDVEDRRGLPFVGPAGRVLWECVEAAGLDRRTLYVTNAVKHFKHVDRGPRRLHKRPSASEIDACHPWLDAELNALPRVPVVALGAVAGRSLFGRDVRVAASRSQVFDVGGHEVIVTYHPSAVLRADDRASEIRQALTEDLRLASTLAANTRHREA